MYEFKNLEGISYDELTKVWNLAFSDYIVPVNITPEKLEAYFKVAGVDKSQSYGAFAENELVGLLINSIDIYRGRKAAYDAMTGIVPGHRGKGLFSRLFDYTKKSLKSGGISHYYLEVIKTNERAYSIYKRKGGKIEREFSFLEGNSNKNFLRACDAEVTVEPLSCHPNRKFCNYDPSFANRVSALSRNADDYNVVSLEGKNGQAAAVYSSTGRIAQILMEGDDGCVSLAAILAYLSQSFEIIQVSNIPVAETGLIETLLKIGFKIVVNQYEMCIELK